MIETLADLRRSHRGLVVSIDAQMLAIASGLQEAPLETLIEI
jgi:hypothetical protein